MDASSGGRGAHIHSIDKTDLAQSFFTNLGLQGQSWYSFTVRSAPNSRMRILLISYYFPKDAAIGAVRPYQFARLLPRHGIDVWVLTVEPEFAETWDERFVIEGVPQERIIRTRTGSTRRTRLIKKLSQLKRRLSGS